MTSLKSLAWLSFLAWLSAVHVAKGSDVVSSQPWHRRKQSLISSNPFYGRVIAHEELPALDLLVRAAWELPLRTGWRIAFLIQGEEESVEAEQATWSDESDTFMLTFRSRRSDALYFPDSTMNEGRNVLLAAASAEEFRRGERYRYYVFLDADATPLAPWAKAVHDFKSFLSEWEPAVGLPRIVGLTDVFSDSTDEVVPKAVFGFDHIFIAVHAQAAPVLLPYNTSLDTECWWVSQWRLSIVASALFQNQVLLTPTVYIGNSQHATYPKKNCQLAKLRVAFQLRKAASENTQDCFVDPMNPGLLIISDTEQGHTHLHVMNHFEYIAWGRAQRKRDSMFNSSYSINQTDERPCDGELLKYLFLQRRISPTWCEGCSIPEAIAALQLMVANDPYSALKWNELGVWIQWAGDWDLAGTCFVIAERLQLLRGLPLNPIIKQNLEQLEMLMGSEGSVFELGMQLETAIGKELEVLKMLIVRVRVALQERMADEEVLQLVQFLQSPVPASSDM